MGFQAVLDANILLPAPLRDTLLRLAEADLYVPKWSERILAEVARNLVESGRTDAERAARVTETMAAAFPEAMVPASLISSVEPAMTNDPKDRHVLAAAIAAGSEVVVTKNLKHFPAAACESLGIQVVGPDDFLVDLHQVDPSTALRALSDQAAALTRPALTLHDVLDYVANDAPEFAGLIRESLSL
jgi:predicted nucleic acid-binding protein